MTKKVLFEVRERSTDPAFQIVEDENGELQTHYGATYNSEAGVKVGVKMGINASGNTVLSAGAVSYPLGRTTPPSVPTVVTIGDSILTDYGSTATTGATYDAATGIATIQFAAATVARQGDVIDIIGFTDTGYDTFGAEILSYSTAGGYFLTYVPSGVPAGSSTGGTAYYPWQKGVSYGVMARAEFLAKSKFRYVPRNIGGSEIAATIARFDRDVPSANPHLVLLCIGVNDIYNSDATVATLLAGLETLRLKCQKIGATFGVLTPPPQMNTRGNWSTAKLLKHFQYSAAAKAWGIANGCPVFDSATATAGTLNYINPTNATGNPNTGFSVDGVHPSGLGAYAIAKKLAAWFDTILPARDWLVSSVADASNLMNGLFTGTGGTAVGLGTVADNWTTTKSGTVTVVESIEARTVAADGDACGNNQVLTITGAGSGATVTLAHSSVHASVSAGDDLEAGFTLEVTGAADLIVANGYVLTQSATSGNKQAYHFNATSPHVVNIPEDYAGIISIPTDVRGPLAVHGAPSHAAMSFVCKFGTGGAGAAVVKIGRATFRKAT